MIIFYNVKTRVYGLYLGVCMHLLKEGEQLVVMVYQWHYYSKCLAVYIVSYHFKYLSANPVMMR